MKKNLILLFTAAVLFACKEKEVKKNVVEQTQKKELSFANKIEKAHQKDKFLSNDAIQFDTQISFGGNTILDAKISVATTSEYALIELNSGGKIYVDKEYANAKIVDMISEFASTSGMILSNFPPVIS